MRISMMRSKQKVLELVRQLPEGSQRKGIIKDPNENSGDEKYGV